MTTIRWCVAAALLGALLLPATAPAEEATAPERSLLVFGPGAGNADGVIAAGYARERIRGKERPKERVGVTGIPYPTDQPYWLTGDGAASWCPAAGTAPPDLALTVKRARGALDVLESDKAVGIVDEFEASVACLTSVVDPALVAELYLLRGLAWHVDGEEDRAMADFATAAGIHPDLAWDVGYPPEPQQTYLVAREAAGRAEKATFGWRFSLLGDVTVTVDGREVEPFTAVELSPVPHVVQVKDGDQVTSMLMRLDEGRRAVLVDRFGATAAVMAGPTDDLSKVAAETILDALAGQWNASHVVVVDTTFRKDLGEPLVYRYAVGGHDFEVLTALRTMRVHRPP